MMKTALKIAIFTTTLTSLYLVTLFFTGMGIYPLENSLYLFGIFAIFVSLLLFSVSLTLRLWAQKITVQQWLIPFIAMALLQLLLLVPHLAFYRINPDLSNASLLLLPLVAAMKCFNLAALFYYLLRHSPNPTKALSPKG